jgi:hypothetical protein
MELRDLVADERLALVGLMKVVVMADAEVSEDEAGHVQALVDAFGMPEYERLLDAFVKRFPDEASFRTFLGGIKRQDARDLIFATVLGAAEEGAVEGAESDVLDWLVTTWNVKIEIAED